jgi:hypothetical protein
LKAAATTTLQQIGQWTDTEISAALDNITIERDDDNITNYATYAETLVNNAVYGLYAQLDGQYFTFNKNKNNTFGYPFGVLSTAGSGTAGALHFSKTVDKNAVWQLKYVGENKFKLYNPATGQYVGLLYNHPSDGIYTGTQQNSYINMVDAANAAIYDIIPTNYNADFTSGSTTMTQEGLKGYVGIGCTAITGLSGVSATMPRYLHHNASTEKDIYLWDNNCGGTNPGSWQHSSWWMHKLDANTAKYLLGTYAKYPLGDNPCEYTATAEYTAAVEAVEAANVTIPTSQDDLTAFAVSDDVAALMTTVEGITLSQNLPQTGHYIRIKPSAERVAGSFSGYLSNTNQTHNSTNRAQYVETADASTIFYYGDADNSKKTLCNYANGLYLYADGDFLGNCTSASSNTSTYVNFADATAREMSSYYFTFKDGARYAYTDDNRYTDAGGSTDERAGYRFQVEYVNELPLTLAGGVTTFSVPVAVSLPTSLGDAKVFTMSLTDNVLKLTEVTSSTETFAPGTAFVISGGNSTVNFPINYAAEAETNTELGANVAASVYSSDSADSDTTSFIQNLTSATDDDELADAGVTIGFKKLNDGDEIPANAIIVNLPSSNIASQNETFELTVADGETFNTNTTTEIDAVAIVGENSTTVVYDLKGRRVNPSAHGIYIVNGKKIRL